MRILLRMTGRKDYPIETPKWMLEGARDAADKQGLISEIE
jgi:hypothetical protein